MLRALAADVFASVPRVVGDPSQFQLSEVRQVYAVANEMPNILAQQPCYCRRYYIACLIALQIWKPQIAKYRLTRCGLSRNCIVEARPRRKFVLVQQYGVMSARPDRQLISVPAFEHNPSFPFASMLTFTISGGYHLQFSLNDETRTTTRS